MKFNAGFDELGVLVQHHFSGGVYAKEVVIPKGVLLKQHSHDYEHMSVLCKGSVLVRGAGWVESYSAPAVLKMAAGIEHEVTASEDSVWLCIHAAEETDPSKIDEVLIG